MSSPETHFDDDIQRLTTFARPKTADQKSNFQSLTKSLVSSCAGNNARWKRLLLSLVHKRYHLLSPEAKQQENETLSVGDGERCIFYLAVQQIFEQAALMENEEPVVEDEEASKAFGSLVKIAPLAGGSRDVCAIIEDSMSLLHESAVKDQEDMKSKLGNWMQESLSLTIGKSILYVLRKLRQGGVYSHLSDLIDGVAATLDRDLELVRKQDGDDENELPSTLHVFLPHHERGRNKKRKNPGSAERVSVRQAVNSVAEILIWSQTSVAQSNPTFVHSFESFIAQDVKKEELKKSLHNMQAIIRNFRKELNNYARQKGFMLSDQFALDATQLSLGKICRGKAGDINLLTRRAKKKNQPRVLKLIGLRFASDPAKITKFESVGELCRTWMPADSDDEVKVADRDIQVSRLKATIAYLQKTFKAADCKGVVVTSMENSTANNIAAVLAAAAMAPWDVNGDPSKAGEKSDKTKSKLFLAGEEQKMDTFEECLQLVDRVHHGLEKNKMDVVSFMEDGVATTKAVINMIDRNVGNDEALILITSAVISLPDDVMKGLSDRGCAIHCHDADDIGDRLNREKAELGDITISLAWDTVDDLDLHVILPTNEELYYNNKVSADGSGRLDVDMNAGGPKSKEPVENVFLGNLDRKMEALRGKYKVFVQNYDYHSGKKGYAIPFRVVIAKNGKKERFDGECKGSGEASNANVCEFNYEGRTVPFPRDEANKEAFGTSNLVNMTSSSGQTLEALANLVKALEQQAHLDEVRQLDDADHPEQTGTTRPVEITERPVVAEDGKLEVTNRDRHDILLAKLPKRFHLIVAEMFGGETLVEECAKEVARRMVADKIPMSELGNSGYPNDVVVAVKRKLVASGINPV